MLILNFEIQDAHIVLKVESFKELVFHGKQAVISLHF